MKMLLSVIYHRTKRDIMLFCISRLRRGYKKYIARSEKNGYHCKSALSGAFACVTSSKSSPADSDLTAIGKRRMSRNSHAMRKSFILGVPATRCGSKGERSR